MVVCLPIQPLDSLPFLLFSVIPNRGATLQPLAKMSWTLSRNKHVSAKTRFLTEKGFRFFSLTPDDGFKLHGFPSKPKRICKFTFRNKTKSADSSSFLKTKSDLQISRKAKTKSIQRKEMRSPLLTRKKRSYSWRSAAREGGVKREGFRFKGTPGGDGTLGTAADRVVERVALSFQSPPKTMVGIFRLFKISKFENWRTNNSRQMYRRCNVTDPR